MRTRFYITFCIIVACFFAVWHSHVLVAHADPLPQPTESEQGFGSSITVHDQSITDGLVRIDQIHALTRSWIVVHQVQPDGNRQIVLGAAVVEAGETQSLTVALAVVPDPGTMLLVMLHQDAGMAPNLDAPLQVSGQPIAHRFVILAPAQSSTLPDTGVAYANVGWLGWFAWLLLAFGWMITKRINKAAVPLLALATEGAWATPVTRGRFLTAPDGACYGLTDTRDPSAHFAFARRYKRPAVSFSGARFTN